MMDVSRQYYGLDLYLWGAVVAVVSVISVAGAVQTGQWTVASVLGVPAAVVAAVTIWYALLGFGHAARTVYRGGYLPGSSGRAESGGDSRW